MKTADLLSSVHNQAVVDSKKVIVSDPISHAPIQTFASYSSLLSGMVE